LAPDWVHRQMPRQSQLVYRIFSLLLWFFHRSTGRNWAWMALKFLNTKPSCYKYFLTLLFVICVWWSLISLGLTSSTVSIVLWFNKMLLIIAFVSLSSNELCSNALIFSFKIFPSWYGLIGVLSSGRLKGEISQSDGKNLKLVLLRLTFFIFFHQHNWFLRSLTLGLWHYNGLFGKAKHHSFLVQGLHQPLLYRLHRDIFS